MAVAHDNSAETTGTTTSPISQTIVPVGTARGVKVGVEHGGTASDLITSITVQGSSGGEVPLDRVNHAVDTATEPGASYQYFLGANVPPGTLTIRVYHTGTSDVKWINIQTLTASADVEVSAAGGANNNATPSVRLYKPRSGMALFDIYSGLAAPSDLTVPGTVTGMQDHDFGNFVARADYETSPSSGDQVFTYTGTSDDLAFCAISVSEVVASGPKHLVTCLPNAQNATTTVTFKIGGNLVGKRIVCKAVSRDHTSGTALAAIADDGGGNSWSSNLSGDTDRKVYLWEKEGTEADVGAMVTISGAVGSLSAQVHVYDGVGAIEDVSLETNASGNETHASLDPTTDGSLVGLVVADYANDTNAVTSPSGATSGAMAIVGESLSSGGSDCRLTVAVDLVASGATGSVTWSQTNATTKSILFSLPPAAADLELAADITGQGTLEIELQATGVEFYEPESFFVPPVSVTGWSSGAAGDIDEWPRNAADNVSRSYTGSQTINSLEIGFADLSPAPGDKKGFRLWIAWFVANSNGVRIDAIRLLDGASVLHTISTPAITVNETTGSQPNLYVVDFPDSAFSGDPDIDDLRVQFDTTNLHGSNNSLTVTAARLSKSPFTAAQEATLPASLDGQDFVCYRADDLVLLNAVDDDFILVWPDASGSGRHLVIQVGTTAVFKSDDGNYVDFPADSANRLISHLGVPWVDNTIVHTRALWYTGTEGGTRTPAVLAAADADFHDLTIATKFVLAVVDSTGDKWVIMSGDGSGGAHIPSTTAATINDWIRLTYWTQVSGNEHLWENDDGSPVIDAASGTNTATAFSIGGREDDNAARYLEGRISEFWMVDGTGISEADIDDARDEWVNGPGGDELLRIQDESIELSEDDLRFLDRLRIHGESLEIDESDLRLIDLLRLRNESIELDETDLRFRDRLYQEDEAVEIDEADLHFRGRLRQYDETVEVDEDDLHFRGRLYQEDETTQISEADIYYRGRLRLHDESLELSESVLRFRDLLRIRNETSEISEEILRSLHKLRLSNEPVNLSESDLHFRGRLQQHNESVEIDEADLHYRGRLRQQDESAEISENTLQLKGVFRQQDEDINISEDDSWVRGIVRLYDESVGISEASLRFRDLVRQLDEAIEVDEQNLRYKDLIRQVSEFVEVNDADLRFLGLVRLANETVQVSEQDVTLRTLLKVVLESVEISEAEIHVVTEFGVALIKVEDESIEIDEGVVFYKGITKLQEEILELEENLFRLRDLVRIQTETEQIPEVKVVLRDLIRQQSEVVQLPENILRAMHLLRDHSESIAVTEIDSHFGGRVVVFGEAIQISETNEAILGFIIPTPPFSEASIIITVPLRDTVLQDFARGANIYPTVRDVRVTNGE